MGLICSCFKGVNKILVTSILFLVRLIVFIFMMLILFTLIIAIIKGILKSYENIYDFPSVKTLIELMYPNKTTDL